MPLIIYGKPLGPKIPKPLQQLWENFPELKEASEKLKNTPALVLNPKGLLFVGQGEFAGTSPVNTSINFLGTDSATTCHIVVLRETVSGATCLGHFDGRLTPEGVCGMLRTIHDIAHCLGGRFELTIAGGFNDIKHLSLKISDSLLCEFNKVPFDIHLMAATITDMNNVMKKGVPFPVIYGLGVDMKTQEIFPATYTDRGPNYPLRNAQKISESPSFPCIYDLKIRRVVINPFEYSNWTSSQIRKILQLSDEEILKKYSTSPEQEPPNFPEDFRNKFQLMLDNPYPLKTVFQNDCPRYYKQSSEGQWEFDGHTPPSD